MISFRKWAKNNVKNQFPYLLISKIALTVMALFLFLVWLMFMTNNFFAKNNNSFVAKLMNTPLEIMIWPIAIIILFIYIMPIWVTNNKLLLVIFLTLALFISFANLFFLIFLNINSFWIIWLVARLLVITALLGAFITTICFINN